MPEKIGSTIAIASGAVYTGLGWRLYGTDQRLHRFHGYADADAAYETPQVLTFRRPSGNTIGSQWPPRAP